MARRDDDDDYDDEPRRPRPRRNERGGGSAIKIMLGVAGGIMLVGCLGVGGCMALLGVGAKGVAEQKEKRQAAAIEAKKAPLSVSPGDLMSAYKTNGVAADGQYKDQWVRITGRVDKVSKDITDTIYVTFNSGERFEILSVQCFFDDKFTAKAASLSPGQTITVVGRCTGKFGNVLVKECEFVE